MPSLPNTRPGRATGSNGRSWAIIALNTPTIFISALNAVGFTSSGVAAGSLATVIQSTVYGASTGGVFSVLQSVATRAILPPPLVAAMSVAAVGIHVYDLMRDGNRQNEDGRDEDGGDEDGGDDLKDGEDHLSAAEKGVKAKDAGSEAKEN